MTLQRLKNVVILGAGPGGLAAGHRLSEHGIHPIVLEKLDYVAGLCHTLIKGDFRFDIGGHRWFTKNDELNRWFIHLMRDEIVKVNRVSRIYFEGKYFSYPISIKNVVKNAGVFSSSYAVISYLIAQAKGLTRDDAPQNMEDAYVKQFGRKLYEMFFKNYSEKVWGTSCREISADWVEQRTKGLSIFTALRDALAGSTGKVASLVEEFMYPRHGYGTISERMAEDIVAAGGKVLLNHKVVSVVHENSKVVAVSYEDCEGNSKVMDADAVISSIPLTLLARNMTPPPPDAIIAATKKLRFRDLITVNVMLNREQVTKDTWLYIHDSKIPFARLHEPKNWSREMAPVGKTSIVAEVFCSIGDPVWSLPDEEICERVIDHLVHTLGFIEKEEVIGSFAFRAPQAYPIYDMEYQMNLQKIKDFIAKIEGLQIIGRGGTFRYNNSDHSIETGLMAAENLLGASYRIDSVNEAKEYLEEKRVSL
jgi:protoporphyrinogen oxidase